MDNQDLRTLQLLEEIDRNHEPSQRELAKKLNISLGLANSFIKRLSHKGYFKITTLPKNRIKYIITPKGIAEKSRLTYQYIQFSYQFYRDARQKLRRLFQDFEKEGIRRIAFYGADDLAEIAYLSLQETEIEFVAIFDRHGTGSKFFTHMIKDPADISTGYFDKLLVTLVRNQQEAIKQITDNGFPKEKVASLITGK